QTIIFQKTGFAPFWKRPARVRAFGGEREGCPLGRHTLRPPVCLGDRLFVNSPSAIRASPKRLDRRHQRVPPDPIRPYRPAFSQNAPLTPARGLRMGVSFFA